MSVSWYIGVSGSLLGSDCSDSESNFSRFDINFSLKGAFDSLRKQTDLSQSGFAVKPFV